MEKIGLERFESIGVQNARRMKKIFKIRSVDDFLFAKMEGRLSEIQNKLAAEPKSPVQPDRVQRWADIVDLYRIPKLNARHAEILQAIDINSVEELAHRDPIQIVQKFHKLNDESYFIILQIPTIAEVETWIYYAKLISRQLKVGYDIPLINFFPMITIANAVEFQKYRIWTLEDFESSYKTIPNLRKRVGIPQKVWDKLLNIMDLVRVDGVGVYLANLLYNVGIHTLAELKGQFTDPLYNLIDLYQSKEFNPREKISKEALNKILLNSKAVQPLTGGVK